MAKLHYQDPPTEKDKKSVKSFLSEDEELVLLTGYGNAYLRSRAIYMILWPGIIFILGALGLAFWKHYNLIYALFFGMIAAIIVAIILTIRLNHANRYILTTRRVIIKKGLFAVKVTSALFDKITHIEVDQSFMDKLLMHHGTVIVNTAGANKDEMVLRFIDWPIEFKNLLERLINREREHYGRSASPLVEVEGELVD